MKGKANLDVQLSGGVAKGATIDLVVSESTEVADGVDLSAFYAVENNLAGVLSLSFSACELFLGTAGNSFFQALWEQAGAQGITVSVAAGDSGSAGCDDFNTQATATRGLAVNGLASTPFNVAVGGTDFDDVGNFSTFWNTTNTAPNRTSAKSYIPEVPLNDSCAQQGVSGGCTSPPGSTLQNIFAGGGGPSNCSTSTASGVCQAGTAKPTWQGGSGVPADSVRDTPDVSVFAGDGQNSSFYVVCEADITTPLSCSTSPSIGFLGAGGTSASAQAFAGIMALVNHKLATPLNPAPRQGNANFVLYPLAAKAGNSCDSSVFPPSPTCIFYDITKGNNSVPCTAGSLNCGNTPAGMVLVDPNHTSTPAWTTSPGYDLASGLGSINVNNLAANWNTVNFIGTTTTLSLGPPTPTNIPHGTAVAVNITVTPNSGSVKPTGAVSLLATPGTNEAGIDGFILNSSGTTVAGATTPFLPGGSYSVFARYGGDGTFGASDSTPAIPVIVNKENSLTFLNLVINPFGNFTITANPAPLAYGSSYALRADVTNTVDGFHVGPLCSTGCPTGTVTIKDNGALLDGGTFALNGSPGTTEDQNIQLAPGVHPLTANYGGDNSFNASGPANLTVTINKATSSLSTIGGPAQVNLNALFNLTVTVQTNSNGAAPTGTVTFLDGATALSGTVTTIPTAGSANGPASLQVTLNTSLSTVGNHMITATYSGDTNYNGAGPTGPVTISVLQTGSFTVGGSATAVTAGNAGVSNITLTPSGGFTGPVQVSCPAPPPGVTCPNPPTINVPPGTGQLTVNVAGPSAPGTTAEVRPASRTEYAGLQGGPTGKNGWWKLSAGAGLLGMVLLFLPGRRRYRLWLLCVLSFAMGCGGGSSSGGPIAAATTTRITAPVTKAPQGTQLGFNIAVTASGAPAGNGMVELFDGATLLTTVPVVNGAVTINNSTLIVGTHAISAHYLGDASTQASQSGAVNVTLTGTTQVTISTNPASSNGNTTFNLTIN